MRPALVIALTSLVASAGCANDPAARIDPPQPATESGRAHSFDVRRIASGLDRPTFVGAAPGDPRALWVLEQPGRVVRLARHRRRVVLDLSDRVKLGAEQGLLGIAFHPRFAADGRLYLHWSDRVGDTRVAEFRAREDGSIDRRPVRELLHVSQPEENHNGGQLAFGPDGRLYLGLGDGGGAFDPRETAQDQESLLGKLIATDVDSPEPDWELVLSGLRNPWRFSFDAALGEIWIADVGQDAVEEINRVPIEPDEPAKNLGWSVFEGAERASEDHELDRTGELVFPVAQYHHGDGVCSVTGGLVYGGARLPALRRRYVFGDFCAGTLWSLRGTPGGGAEDMRRERAVVPQLTHIGTDGEGELVLAGADGSVYRAVATTG